MIEIYYKYGGYTHGGTITITNDMVTGKYMIRHDTMYVQIKEKNTWISRIFQGKYWYHYVSEESIHFTETEYFDCKENSK